jgi:hypothetical protein
MAMVFGGAGGANEFLKTRAAAAGAPPPAPVPAAEPAPAAMASGREPSGMPPSGAPSPPKPTAVDQARVQVATDIANERAKVAGEKAKVSPGDWAGKRGGATKRFYNLLERRAVLTRMKTFPGRTYLEQAEIKGVRVGGQLKPAAEISGTGKGRIADILEIDGPNATLEDLKSPSTQLKSVKGGMSAPQVEAEFRSTSEIAKQHGVEQQIIAEAKRTGGQVIVEGRDPISGGTVERALDPYSISSRVTDYTDIGGN